MDKHAQLAKITQETGIAVTLTGRRCYVVEGHAHTTIKAAARTARELAAARKTFRIPDPPAGTFTSAEWAEIEKGRAERKAAGTAAVGDE